MRRSKLQAMAFLASAFIVGSVAGSAGYSWYTERSRSSTGFRGLGERLFDDLGLSCDQRVRMDSVLKAMEDQLRATNAPLRARADSVLAPRRAKADSILAPGRAMADSIFASGRPAVDSIRNRAREAFLQVMSQDQRRRYEAQMAEAARQRQEWEQRDRSKEPTEDACGGALSQGDRGLFRQRSAPGQGRRGGPASPATGRDSSSRQRP